MASFWLCKQHRLAKNLSSTPGANNSDIVSITSNKSALPPELRSLSTSIDSPKNTSIAFT